MNPPGEAKFVQRFRAFLVIRQSTAMSSSRLFGRPLASVDLKGVQTNSSGFRSETGTRGLKTRAEPEERQSLSHELDPEERGEAPREGAMARRRYPGKDRGGSP